MFSYQIKETEGMYTQLSQTMVEYGVSPNQPMHPQPCGSKNRYIRFNHKRK